MIAKIFRRLNLINVHASLISRVLFFHNSSSTVQEPKVGLAVYAATKAAIVGLVRGTSVEVGPGVTVNAVMAGLINTEHVWNLGFNQMDHSLFSSVR